MTRLTLVKRFTYRGDPLEEFSNSYGFVDPPPTNDTEWNTVLNLVAGAEAKIYPSDVFFLRAYGYNDTDPKAHHVYFADYENPGPPPAGEYIPPTAIRGAGDQAACHEWLCEGLSQKGKPIYLRKYCHVPWLSATDTDMLEASYVATLQTYGTAINQIWGGLLGINGNHRAQDGSGKTIPYVTTRTLKRRGKRPPRVSPATPASVASP